MGDLSSGVYLAGKKILRLSDCFVLNMDFAFRFFVIGGESPSRNPG